MRESFILIILPLLAIAARSSNVDRDSFNLYKDRMRARTRDAVMVEPVVSDYSDPYATLQGLEYLNVPIWLPQYRKRNVQKRNMKYLVPLDGRLDKRTSKAALSLMLQSKQDPDHTEEEHSCYAGK
ncbi:uncharacterized protein LOC112057751 [Bicyclus anynana]|uniref:Uncharacterized protein LOC112057751 n=1 Tax=Bicyclus anynana TaxID=110368 RepID=A0ABM3LLP9_BICAN|nr:uncharacterized protein LOC112057751 [Bicyclus anynana]